MKKYTKINKKLTILLSVIMISGCSQGEKAQTNVHSTSKTEQSATVIQAVTDAGKTETSETTEIAETKADTAELSEARTAIPTAAAIKDIDFDEVFEVEQAETTAEATETTTQTSAETTLQTTAETTAQTTTETTVQTTTEATAAPETSAATSESTERTTVPTSQVSTAVPVEDSSYNVIGENNILVSYQDGHYRGLMGCFGTYGLCDIWTEGVNGFAAALPKVNTYNMVIPISSEFYTPESLKSGFTTSQLSKIQYIAEGLKGVRNVDAYSELAKHTDEPIYARTDHHWLPLGAYYAAKAFSEAAGADFPALSEYQGYQRGGYVGSMYTYSKDVHLKNDPEDFVMYVSPNDKNLTTVYYSTYFTDGYESDLFVSRNLSAYYCSFLGSDDRIAHIKTNAGNGRTLVIFKESYGNALVPFLTSGFENIYVCDIRYFDINAVQFCKDVGATDLLFAVCTMTAAGNNGKYVSRIISQ